ncbi:MAG: hypothetical protein JNK02_02755 [Planctomycetes bacterium]|nr:hypothetical protein [Planctomycetota bacterium]
MSTRANSRLLLAADDGWEFLVVPAARARIGHVRAADVDLPFLADVPSFAALVELVEDFHAGARWCLVPGPGVRAGLNEGEAGAGPVPLADGDLVRLAPNLAFRFVAREPGTSAARLDLLGGAECLGAPRVLLLPPGAGGRARVGPSGARTIPVAELVHEIELVVESDALDGRPTALTVRCAGGVAPRAHAAQAPAVRLALPLASTQTLLAHARAAGQPPFALVFRPAGPALER